MKVKSESEVAHLCWTLHNPMDCSLPGSSVHGLLQARVLEWVAIAFSGRWLGLANFIGFFSFLVKNLAQDFPGGAVNKNLPANAGNVGSIPGQGRFHMPWGQLSL